MTRITDLAPVRFGRVFWVALVLMLLTSAPLRAQYRTDASIRPSSPSVTLASPPPHAWPLARVPTVDCELDRTLGRQAASALHSGSGWMIGGVASGVLLGLIGTGIITAVAASSSASTNHVPANVEPLCYRDGYASRAKSMNTTSALTGGLIGTLALVVILISASGS
jgi:hypothetical protein